MLIVGMVTVLLLVLLILSVLPPGRIVAGTPFVIQARAGSSVAHLGRPLEENTASDLTGLTLIGGVYACPSK